MKTADGSYRYCYTVQAVVDSEYQVTVVNELNNVAVDVQQLLPMVKKTRETVGVHPGQILIDAGYCSNSNLEYVQTIEENSDGQTEFSIASGRQKHDENNTAGDVVTVPASTGPLPANASIITDYPTRLRNVMAERGLKLPKAYAQL